MYEGVWSLYNFFQNPNYLRGTGNFTYKALILAGQQKALYHQNYLPRKQLCVLLKPPNHSLQLQLQLHSQLLASYIVPPELSLSQLGTSLLCFYSYSLCYATVLLKFTYYAQEQELFSDYYAFICNYAWQFTTCSKQFLYKLLLECINESTSILYHTMTVLLDYTDCLLQFFINAYIAINICFVLPYYVGIMLNVFNHPLCSKLCWHKGGFLFAMAINFA